MYVDFGGSGVRTEVSGFEISSISWTIDLTRNFKDDKLFLFSGWSMGYRYEPSSIAERGHYLNAKFFKTARKFRGLEPKFGLGIDYGYPTMNYDKSEFTFRDGAPVSSEFIILNRNADILAKSVGKDAVINMFMEAGIRTQAGRFIAEIGLRGTVTDFTHGVFDFQNGTARMDKKNKILPAFFFKAGIRLGGKNR